MLENETIAQILSLNSWEAVLDGLKACGFSYERKGDIAVIKSDIEEINTSRFGEEFSLQNMQKRLDSLPIDAQSMNAVTFNMP